MTDVQKPPYTDFDLYKLLSQISQTANSKSVRVLYTSEVVVVPGPGITLSLLNAPIKSIIRLGGTFPVTTTTLTLHVGAANYVWTTGTANFFAQMLLSKLPNDVMTLSIDSAQTVTRLLITMEELDV